MKEAVKEELSWAACQLSLRTPAASGCLGDGPLWRTASAVALHCELWRQSVTVMGGYTMWTEKVPLEVNSTWSEGAGVAMKNQGGALHKYLMRICTLVCWTWRMRGAEHHVHTEGTLTSALTIRSPKYSALFDLSERREHHSDLVLTVFLWNHADKEFSVFYRCRKTKTGRLFSETQTIMALWKQHLHQVRKSCTPLFLVQASALSLSCCHIFCLSLRVPAFCTNLCNLPLCFPSVYFSRHRSISSCTSSALKPLHYIDAVYCCQFYPFQISHPICLYLILLLTGFPQHLHLMAYVILHESTYHLFSHCQRVSSG